MRKKIYFWIFTGFLLFGLGCESYFENPYFTVKESGLNWLSIRYYDYHQKPIRKINVRLDGNGIIDVKAGSSSLVANSFAYDMSEASWADIQRDRIVIPRKEIVPLFQVLVDNGLFVERLEKKESTYTNESIFVTANIQNKTCGSGNDDIFASDPDLAEHLKNVILMFYHPRPKSRR